MDIQLPVLDGVEASRRLRSLDSPNRNIPVIALTAYCMAGDREKFLQAGMDDYLPKPLKKKSLLHALEKVMHGASR
jgi:CheY-like chemotaxis protein